MPRHDEPVLDRFSDVPLCRAEYGKLQKEALKIMGRQASTRDFNDMVRAHMDNQGVATTPRNWLRCGSEVISELLTEMGREPEDTDEFFGED